MKYILILSMFFYSVYSFSQKDFKDLLQLKCEDCQILNGTYTNGADGESNIVKKLVATNHKFVEKYVLISLSEGRFLKIHASSGVTRCLRLTLYKITDNEPIELDTFYSRFWDDWFLYEIIISDPLSISFKKLQSGHYNPLNTVKIVNSKFISKQYNPNKDDSSLIRR